ncbi:MAG: helix-turn-helix domain-containing protein, partial [Acidimicrobiales bacterium]
MINNDREYRLTRAEARRFAAVVEDLGRRAPADEADPAVRELQLSAVQGQLDSLRAELADYEALRDGQTPPPDLSIYQDLPAALVRARIAAGLSQRELAGRLGVVEQQIQRYEASEYASTSWARLRDVITVLRKALV